MEIEEILHNFSYELAKWGIEAEIEIKSEQLFWRLAGILSEKRMYFDKIQLVPHGENPPELKEILYNTDYSRFKVTR